MAAQRVVSADSHVVEPPDLWERNLPKHLRERAPRAIANPRGPGFLFVAEGTAPFPVAGVFAAGQTGRSGKRAEETAEHMAKGYDQAPPGAYDATARMLDQDTDGVEAEVLYPSLGLPLFALKDGELQTACFGVYNDWLAEMVSDQPRRVYGVGLVSLHDVDRAIDAVQALAAQNLRGVLIWASPPPGRSYAGDEFDRFWAAACDADLPVSLHSFAGHGPESALPDLSEPTAVQLWHATAFHEVQRTLIALIVGGVLERFPRLKIVSVENDVGWMPHVMSRMDHSWGGSANGWAGVPRKPSDYFRRQIYGTFQDDYSAPATVGVFGAENYMWASDYPHADSTWPDSRKWIDEHLTKLPEEVTNKIVFENAVKLYRMELD